jgi:uncharacterized protein (DUF736 family)
MWKKKTKNNNDYYSVKVELEDGSSFWVNLFWNKHKNQDKHPDYKTIDELEKEKLPEESPF